MNIGDIVQGMAAGVGLDLSPDEKTAYYVEWSIGELCQVEVDTGKVQKVAGGLQYPEDVEVDWDTGEIFISERIGEISKISSAGQALVIANPGGAPHQLALVKEAGKRYLFCVGYDSGCLFRVDVDTGAVVNFLAGLGHPVGLVLDPAGLYAYITEQDSGSLTRVELASATTNLIYTGLVQPFYLAWDENASGIFCVQRDPANSLVKINLGPPITLETVATGLAWRPSGVAPNSDNQKIYICADQKLQLISFDGVPAIVPDPLPFEVHSIQFNYQGSPAISLKDSVTDAYLHDQPEWIQGTRNEPAAYERGVWPGIKVVFKQLASTVSGSYAVGATGNLGGIRRREITPVFSPSGLTDPLDFELMWPLPGSLGKNSVSCEWYIRSTAAPAVPIPGGTTAHTLCTTWKKLAANPSEILEDWVYKQPMLWTSEWAAGKNNEKDICDAIIQNLPSSGLKYGISGYSVRDILLGGGGMCGGWYKMFQHLAHCQGVFVNRRSYLVDYRRMPNNEEKWCAIVIKDGGLNQPEPTYSAYGYKDVNSQYPIGPTTQINEVTEKRYRFLGMLNYIYDGHCINFLVYNGQLYLYDPSFGTGPFVIAPFSGPDAPLPPKDFSILGGAQLSSFKAAYLNSAVDYMLGSLYDGAGTLQQFIGISGGITVKTAIIPDLLGGDPEITFYWGS